MAQAWEYIKIALMNIRSNKGRSVLTMLGIIIGITSVIMIMSIGDGVKGQVSDELNAMAGGLIGIYVNNEQSKEKIYFDEDDFDAIREKIDGVKGVTPVYTLYGSVVGKKGEFTAYTSGGSESMEFYQTEPIVDGRYFTAADYYAGNRVCVITQQAAKKLFGTTDVIGMSIEVTLSGTTQDLTIVGIRQDSASAMFSMYGNMINIEVPLNLLSMSFGLYFDGFTDFYVISELPKRRKTYGKQAQCKESGRDHGSEYAGSDFSDQLGDGKHLHLRCDRGGHFPSGRRHRRDEYHAGVGNGTNPGDRHPQIAGSENRLHPPAVFVGIGDYYPAGRTDRHCPRSGGGAGHRRSDRLFCQNQRGHCTWGFRFFGGCWNFLRYLSGEEGSEDEPDRGFAA